MPLNLPKVVVAPSAAVRLEEPAELDHGKILPDALHQSPVHEPVLRSGLDRIRRGPRGDAKVDKEVFQETFEASDTGSGFLQRDVWPVPSFVDVPSSLDIERLVELNTIWVALNYSFSSCRSPGCCPPPDKPWSIPPFGPAESGLPHLSSPTADFWFVAFAGRWGRFNLDGCCL
jgi:hypothetical protein